MGRGVQARGPGLPRLNAAIEATTAAGILTRDLGGAASTEDMTKALIDALNR